MQFNIDIDRIASLQSFNTTSENNSMLQWFYLFCRTVRSGLALKNRSEFPEEFWESRGQSDLCEQSKVYLFICIYLFIDSSVCHSEQNNH